MVALPSLTASWPKESVWMTLRTHVESGPEGIGSGGPKKQLASSAHDPGPAAQSASVVQACPSLLRLTQCFPGPAPFVHVLGSVPVAKRWTALGSLAQQIAARSRMDPSGFFDGGVALPFPPPR